MPSQPRKVLTTSQPKRRSMASIAPRCSEFDLASAWPASNWRCEWRHGSRCRLKSCSSGRVGVWCMKTDNRVLPAEASNEASLRHAAVTGDRGAFATLYEQHRATVYRYLIRRLNSDPHLA